VIFRSLRHALIGLFLLLPTAETVTALTIPPGGSLSIGGTLDLGCTDLDVQGSVLVGAGRISQAATIDIAASGVLDGGSGTISLGGNWNNAGSFVPGSGTVTLVDDCSAGPAQITGNTVFNNLTLTSANGRTFVIPAGRGITVTGALTLQGLPALPIQLASSSGLPAFITLGAGAQLVSSNATVPPNVQTVMAAGAPVITGVASNYGSARISFTAPGGSPFTSYTVTCVAAGQTTRTATGTGSPITIQLTGSTRYSCVVTASDGITTSIPSQASPVTAYTVVPMMNVLLFDD
jgi:hypothetical protein